MHKLGNLLNLYWTKSPTVLPNLPGDQAMAQNKPTGHQCLNLRDGKTSHLLLVGHNKDFVNPVVTAVTELNADGISFNVAQTILLPGNRRVALRLVCVDTRAGGGGPVLTDGLLGITLVSGNPPVLTPVPDVPVDYIDDPGGP